MNWLSNWSSKMLSKHADAELNEEYIKNIPKAGKNMSGSSEDYREMFKDNPDELKDYSKEEIISEKNQEVIGQDAIYSHSVNKLKYHSFNIIISRYMSKIYKGNDISHWNLRNKKLIIRSKWLIHKILGLSLNQKYLFIYVGESIDTLGHIGENNKNEGENCQIYDMDNHSIKKKIKIPEFNSINSFEFSADSQWMFIGGSVQHQYNQNTLATYDFGIKYTVQKIRLTKDNKIMLTSSYDFLIRQYCLKNKMQIKKFPIPGEMIANCIEFSKDSNYILLGTSSLKKISLESNDIIECFPKLHTDAGVKFIKFRENSDILSIIYYDGSISIFNYQKMMLQYTYKSLEDKKETVFWVDYLKDGKSLQINVGSRLLKQKMTEEKNLELIVSSIKKSIMDSVILSPNKDYLILHKKISGGQKVQKVYYADNEQLVFQSNLGSFTRTEVLQSYGYNAEGIDKHGEAFVIKKKKKGYFYDFEEGCYYNYADNNDDL